MPRYRTRILLACEECGAPIERTPFRLSKNKHQFCSAKCRAIYFAKSDPPEKRKAETRARFHYEERKRSLQARFWEKVRVVDDADSCWEWQASSTTTGYGEITLGERHRGKIKAHRASWLIHFGEIPDRLFVCHKCDNRLCVRPSHLFLGTAQDNVTDMVLKGRHLVQKRRRMGSAHHNAKFSEDSVRRYRAAYEAGTMTWLEIAQQTNTASSTVFSMLARETWKHVF